MGIKKKKNKGSLLKIRKHALVYMFHEVCTIIWGWKQVEKVNMVLDEILEKCVRNNSSVQGRRWSKCHAKLLHLFLYFSFPQ